MQLIIAEKPSVAQTIAKVLGAAERKEGYFQGPNCLVTWCIGHLVSLAEPDSYDPKYARWAIDDLPILPEPWQLVVSKDKTKQYQVIHDLMHDSRVHDIVCAADAGREGELIFRLVYTEAECSKPVKRLWISSLEEQAIRDGFADLRNGSDYDRLYLSARCRAQADWLVGINASRLYSLLYGGSLSIGRVQTPTLAMLVERHEAATGFKKQIYYLVHIRVDGIEAASTRFDDKETAERVQTACHHQQAVIDSIAKEPKTIPPPKLFDLTTLQREANRLLSYTAQQTLDLAQSLYEKRLLSYPRTDSAYLSEDLQPTLAKLLTGLPKLVGLPYEVDQSDAQRVIRNDKVTDHHAILPTLHALSTDLSTLPESERNILHLVGSRVLTTTSAPHRYEAIVATLSCAGHSFTMRGRRAEQKGWKAIETAFRASLKGVEATEDTEEETEVLELQQAQVVTQVDAILIERTTSPPKEYNEDTLLAAMEAAGKAEMNEEAERKGLGTPATRAGIIEKLIQGGYVERKKRQLIPTAKGIHLIAIVPVALKSPSLTAEWENALAQVADGSLAADIFLDQIKRFVVEIVAHKEFNKEIRAQIAPLKEVIGTCPRCGEAVSEGYSTFYCSNPLCTFALWKNDRFFTLKKKTLTKATAIELLSQGRTFVTGWFSAKTGKHYDAFVLLNDTGNYVNYKLEFTQGG